ncbi:hypothetical protein GUJ93_ZPchr0008g13510 [Zizania palustris]|uniref:ZF-HD dimerization-type domain-containing protein n=1 Tax=Zizania palustris TaxID=103762 RepID=A0A8J5VK28_ZIZPA|nr:hypothetical protein GUJ93_ZPchr0008g13510 [Zizania palustris]
MPSPAADPSDPALLMCAACGCHRNFHRRLPEKPPSPPLLALPPPQPLAPVAAPQVDRVHCSRERGEEAPQVNRVHGGGRDDDDDEDNSEDSDDGLDYEDDQPASPVLAPAALPPGYVPSATHRMLPLGTGAPGSAPAVSSRSPYLTPSPMSAPGVASAAAAVRKRFRTKFSPEQKQRMQALSERLGWRLQKRDEAVLEACCHEISVGKGVFKVWMHNNKHNFLGGHSARRSAAAAANLHPSTRPVRLPPAPPPVLDAEFNINGSSTDAPAADHPATASGTSGSLTS